MNKKMDDQMKKHFDEILSRNEEIHVQKRPI